MEHLSELTCGKQIVNILKIHRSRAVALGILVAVGIVVYCVRGNKSPEQKPPVREQAVDLINRQGNLILQRIDAFHDEFGIWPHSLDELVPDYSTTSEISGWSFNFRRKDSWTLSFRLNSDLVIEYIVSNGKPGTWELTDGEQSIALSEANTIAPRPANNSSPRLDKRFRDVMDQRIRTSADPFWELEGAFVLAVNGKDFLLARYYLEMGQENFPNNWWFFYADGYLASLTKEQGWHYQLFQSWVEQHPSFGHYILLADCSDGSLDEESISKMIAAALRSPVGDVACENQPKGLLMSIPYFFCRAAVLAAKHNHPEQVLTCCDLWESWNLKHESASDRTIHVFRAIAYAQQKKQELFQKSVALAKQENDASGRYIKLRFVDESLLKILMEEAGSIKLSKYFPGPHPMLPSYN